MSEGEVSKLEREAAASSEIDRNCQTGMLPIVVVDCRGYNGTLHEEVKPHTTVSFADDLKSSSPNLCYGCERMYEQDGASRLKVVESAPKKESSRLYRGLALLVPGQILF